MVAVKVRNEHRGGPIETQAGMHHLPLGSFTAVEQNQLAIPSNGDGRQAPILRRQAPPCSQENHVDP